MLTGVETAGLVLASFPLLISALEHYREGFESLKEWWKFRTEFLAFVHDIGRQSVLFNENLEELLSPLITSDTEMSTLLEDPCGAAWRTPALEEKLKDRLPKSYQSYRNTIDDMYGAMDILQRKLGLEDGKITWTDGANRMKWEYEFRRIKFVLSKKKREKLVRDLTTNNEELQKLFSSSERLAPLRKRRRTPQAFKQIREQACGLYSVLTTGWRCRCPGPAPAHQANLLLEKRIESSDQKTKSCKGSLKGSKVHLKVLFFLTMESPTKPWSWQQTEIRLLGGSAAQLSSLASPNATSTTAILSDLSNTFETNLPSYRQALKRHHKKPAFPQIIVQPPTDVIVDELAKDLVEISDLCAAVQKAHHDHEMMPLGYLRDTQDFLHAFYPPMEPTRLTEDAETVTLADLLSRSRKTSATGQMILSRQERYSIAVTLASSLLQLYSSPWIGETWNKNEIYFLKAPKGSPRPIIVEKPYISRKFASFSSQSSIPSREGSIGRTASPKSIQALGIMILELCFGQAIEDQPIRAKYLGPDGEPNDMTDFCTAQNWWLNDALGEGGPELYEAIRRCLFCAFGPRSTDLEDDELRAATYSEVVEPLESAVQQFSSGV